MLKNYKLLLKKVNKHLDLFTNKFDDKIKSLIDYSLE